MNISRLERLALNNLSKEIFGTSSHWMKLIEKGTPEVLTEEVTETVPGEKEGDPEITRQVQIPLKTPSGAVRYTVKRYTVATVTEFMNELKIKLEKARAEYLKQQEELKAKQEATRKAQIIQEVASGSAT